MANLPEFYRRSPPRPARGKLGLSARQFPLRQAAAPSLAKFQHIPGNIRRPVALFRCRFIRFAPMRDWVADWNRWSRAERLLAVFVAFALFALPLSMLLTAAKAGV
jgi:hypothetical protein